MIMGKNVAELVEKLREIAIRKGANPNLIKEINARDILIPDWPRWKCQFGCDLYGDKLCCPPFVPSPDETREFITDYTKALIVGFTGDFDNENWSQNQNWMKRIGKINKILLKLEIETFKSGFVKAFVFYAGGCTLCTECVTKELPKDIHPKMAKKYCKHKDKMRPSAEAVGIDVFGTVEKAGLDIKVLTEKDSSDIRSYGILLIE